MVLIFDLDFMKRIDRDIELYIFGIKDGMKPYEEMTNQEKKRIFVKVAFGPGHSMLNLLDLFRSADHECRRLDTNNTDVMFSDRRLILYRRDSFKYHIENVMKIISEFGYEQKFCSMINREYPVNLINDTEIKKLFIN